MKVSYRTANPEYDYGVREDGSYGRFIIDEHEKIIDCECDRESFITWFKKKAENVKSIVVETEKEIWLWTPKVEKNGRKAGGWELVKKIK